MLLPVCLTITANVLQLPEGGDFGAIHCQPSTNFDRSTTLDLTTEPPLLGRCCYRALCLLLWSFKVLKIESANLVPVETSFDSTRSCSLHATSSVG